jgi:hypothetical protein
MIFFGLCEVPGIEGAWQKNPKVKAGKEGAFKSSVEWFKEHL